MTVDSGFADLTGRTVLVTGAGQGVGRAIAVRSAQRGATTVVNDFHRSRAEDVADEIKAQGGNAYPIQCDVTDFGDVTAMVDQVRQRLGVVDVLVNNAGNAGPVTVNPLDQKPFWETDPSEWTQWLGTNLFGVLNACRAVLPHMIDQNWGRIVSVISDAGRVGEASLAVYGGAKAGAAGLSRGLAKAVGRYSITVNCVALGTMNTGAVADLTGDPTTLKRLLAGYPIRRLGEPDDAANLIAFLASESASWITGQTYPVNGGYSVAL